MTINISQDIWREIMENVLIIPGSISLLDAVQVQDGQ